MMKTKMLPKPQPMMAKTEAAAPKPAARPRLLRADHLAQALVRAAAKTTSQPVRPLLTDMSGLTM